jgi:hypothetical protein
MLVNCNSWLTYNVHGSLRLSSGQAGLTTNGSPSAVRPERSRRAPTDADDWTLFLEPNGVGELPAI